MISYHTPAKPDYLLIRNSYTNEDAVIDLKMSRYKRIAKGFLNSLRMSSRILKHIVLTQAKESYRPTLLNNFLNSLRRFYGDVVYVWTVEVQEERREKYGDVVLHWHMLVAFEEGTEFKRDDILRLQGYWKYGHCEVIPVRSVSMRYLLKYITKALDVPLGLTYQIKRISSSRVEGWLKQSMKRIMQAYEFFKGMWPEKGLDALSEFYWYNGNAYLWDEWDIGGYAGRVKQWIYKKSDWGWRVVDQLQGEPF